MNRAGIDFEAKPIAFYPYTSAVHDRVFQVEFNQMPEIKLFLQDLIDMFNDAGIKCARDNKIAFEVESHGKRIFYGFYDWIFSIGFSVSMDSWKKPVRKEDK